MSKNATNILNFKGKISNDRLTRILYSTDASAYCEMPRAVAFPEDEDDIIALVKCANQTKTPLIPRAAGTSIAGQVVGDGVVMDIGRHLNKIIEINAEERWVRVQPGVVRDELNIALRPYGLFFSPETSTSNRCMIGGMVGNNSCGSHSLRYGSVRDHLLEAKVILSDGSTAVFKHYTVNEINDICASSPKDICWVETEHAPSPELIHANSIGVGETGHAPSLQVAAYKFIDELLSSEANQKIISETFPSPELKRRNNGYAIDLIKDTDGGMDLCKLLCGSEGTLAIATELKLDLDPLPPKNNALVCVHCSTLESVFRANLIAIEKGATAVELIDDNILKLSQKSAAQRGNAFFVEGEPAAIMAVEFTCDTEEELQHTIDALISQIKREVTECYAFPVLRGADIQKVWNLRKAGLGLLSNMEGDAKPVSVIEDTAVAPSELGAYVVDIKEMLRELGLECVFYAHIGTGELHLRPILNLKTDEGKRLFREVATRTAMIVRKHHGSLSGEHGDGRLRGEFIPMMYGEEVYGWFRELKKVFDPNGILNPGKIVDTKPMDDCLRYIRNGSIEDLETTFAYNGKYGGLHYIREIEKCNGAADCRKTRLFSGVMCPQYKATKEEKDSTRARANVLRYTLLNMGSQGFGDKDVLELMEECLSCKGCKHDCPSTVDMTKLKAEYLQQTYDRHGVPLRKWLIGMMPELERIGAIWPWAYNAVLKSGVVHWVMGFDRRRKLPEICRVETRPATSPCDVCGVETRHASSPELIHANSIGVVETGHAPSLQVASKVLLFVDEFMAREDIRTRIAFTELAHKMGYEVEIAPITNSGRTLLSEGMLRKAKKLATNNVNKLRGIVSNDYPMVVLEPAAWSAFKDEYRDLVEDAEEILDNILLYDEWVTRKFVETGHAPSPDIRCQKIHLHTHCHQKALSNGNLTKQMLETIPGVTCEIIEASCCGMAGAYGYTHYERSREIASPLTEFVKNCPPEDIIVAPGISCRRQIMDLTGREVLHPVEVLNRLFG